MKGLCTISSMDDLKEVMAAYWHTTKNKIELKSDGRICKRRDDSDNVLDTGADWQSFPWRRRRKYRYTHQAVLLYVGGASKQQSTQTGGSHGKQ